MVLEFLGLVMGPGAWIRWVGYGAIVFEFDVGEKGGIGEISLAAGAAEVAGFGFFEDLALIAAHYSTNITIINDLFYV